MPSKFQNAVYRSSTGAGGGGNQVDSEVQRREIIKRLLERAMDSRNRDLAFAIRQADSIGWDPRRPESAKILTYPGGMPQVINGRNIGPKTIMELNRVTTAMRNWMPVPLSELEMAEIFNRSMGA